MSAIAAGVLLKSLTVDQQVRIEELVVSEKDPVIQSIIHVPKNQTFQKAMTGRFDKANVRFWIKADSSSKVGKKRGREETARELISDIFDGYTLVNDVSKLLSPVSELLGTRESLRSSSKFAILSMMLGLVMTKTFSSSPRIHYRWET